MFLLTWSIRNTNAGRSLFQLSRWGRGTSASGSSLLPTPDTMPEAPNQSCNRQYPKNLLQAAKDHYTPPLLPTPRQRDWKGQSQRGIHAQGDSLANIDQGDGTPIAGHLNPEWVEWLMGLPTGWTVCDASGTPSSHSKSFPSSEPLPRSRECTNVYIDVHKMTTEHIIVHGSVHQGLASLPDESVQCIVTSPPYWGLRAYGTEPQVWGGDPACQHDWKETHPAGYRSSDTNPGPLQSDGNKNRERLISSVCSTCDAWRGELGLEPTPEMYVQHLVEIFREVRRVLRKDGVVWLNIGDSYATNGIYIGDYKRRHPEHHDFHTDNSERYPQKQKGFRGGEYNIKPKDLVGIPWRLAFALQEDGWWLRRDVIWNKPNPMPESTRDRPTSSHEYVFLLTKRATYFYDQDAIREEPVSTEKATWDGYGGKSWHDHKDDMGKGQSQLKSMPNVSHPAGRNKRSVWTITTQPYLGAHFATFPTALVEPCIKAGTSERGCCPKCGAPWVRVVEKGEPDDDWKASCGADSTGEYHGESEKFRKQDALGKATYTGFNARYKAKQQNASDVKRRILEGMRERISTWEPGCDCIIEGPMGAAEPVPCVVLDPFAGSGTVAKVARDLGRFSVSIELNPEYVEMIKKRMRFYEQLTPVVEVISLKGGVNYE